MGFGLMTYGTHAESGYQSQAIPPRRMQSAQQSALSSPVREAASAADPFTEISLSDAKESSGHVFGSSCTAKAQIIEQSYEKAHRMFSEMRHITRQGYYYKMSQEEIFYKQAKLMEDFTDDYCYEDAFKCYYPRYQKMDSSQLRTYFTWRTKVRSGHITETSLSYAFLYIYELLHNVGASDPEDGLNKLMEFWVEYRAFNPLVDKYVLPWLKDYHVYYPLPHSFRSFAESNCLQHYYPAVFCFSSNQENSFDLFSQISAYDIKKSIFYTEGTEDLIRSCFFFVLERLRESFPGKKKFEDYLFYTSRKKSKWMPFGDAFFYPALTQADRTVEISDRESYECIDQKWSAKIVLPSDQGRQLVGYIMKETEAFLRGIKQFKYKISADLSSCKAVDQSKFEKRGISIPDIVKKSCEQFYELYTWKKVSVDLGNLHSIREEAYQIQEKLLVPEEGGFGRPEQGAEAMRATPVAEPASPATPTNNVNSEPGESVIAAASGNSTATGQTDTWTEFRLALTETESGALLALLQDEPVKDFALKNNIMLEVLVDGINQKAMDYMGDTLLDIDDSVYIFEEYEEDLRKAVT